ncbi:hydantoinase/oxoprolinase family protein [Natroniella sulfidigena]|uniref:hydantoinase/oxoprolinase family protein n=1 Tax=Natroniella sulfidigena TaxID=723921 RepID=UPI00200A3A94|nr:hydantoinase/oxoprolinase family protein [Natroniella sulfidigena]MCK8818173.1 hydantoinase/oxoprolinase family protein [Natroniella sulfidigena]
MLLGIDIGGTHTDGVLLEGSEVVKANKLPTDKNNLAETILTSCQRLIADLDNEQVERVVLSTTLVTNLIMQEEFEEVGLVLIPGTGLNPAWYSYSPVSKIIGGAVDHRGREIEQIDQQELKEKVADLVAEGIDKISICGKFATRNPQQELEVKEIIKEEFPEIENIVLSHEVVGQLNYPRRVATTYLNSIVQKRYINFVDAIKEGLDKLDLTVPVYILKADGGTMPLKDAYQLPIESINSGPAASIMGMLATGEIDEVTVGVDIGGTTTDISLFVDGEPLFEPEGMELAGYQTLVKGLYNQSLACGGDSLVKVEGGELNVGPERKGVAACYGGSAPTVTDALASLGLIEDGEQKRAEDALKPLANSLDLEVVELAEQVIQYYVTEVKNKLEEILAELNNRPVYTINQLLTETKIEPQQLVGIGGPAQALIPKLAEALDLEFVLPEQSGVVNAIGAGLAKVTKDCTLYADTEQGYCNISELGIKKKVTQDFNLEDAKQEVKKNLQEELAEQDPEIEITTAESFNLVRGFRTTGRIIEVAAQRKPGIVKSS